MLKSVAVVFKTLIICTLNASKVIYVSFNLNCELQQFLSENHLTDLFNPVVAYGAYDASMGIGKRVPFHGIQ